MLPASFAGDADRLRRFEQEARAASALNHPNILTVHDLGTEEGAPYVVSELLEGETLRSALASGPLPPRRAIEYAVQIARGLAAAHDKGIVHRDLKPENLFVTRRRSRQDPRLRPREADAAAGPDRPGRRARRPLTAGTEPGVDPGHHRLHVPGAGAGQADRRPDRPLRLRRDPLRDALRPARVLGRVARRHAGGDPQGGSARSLTDDAGIPPALERDRPPLPREEPGRAVPVGARSRVRARALLRFARRTGIPGRRRRAGIPASPPVARGRRGRSSASCSFSSPSAGSCGAGSSGRRRPVTSRSLAVLPLKDLSGEPRQEYFADGDDGRPDRGPRPDRVREGHLAARSAMQYKGTKKSLREIARELGVDAVLEGSVARIGDRVRITSELIARGERHAPLGEDVRARPPGRPGPAGGGRPRSRAAGRGGADRPRSEAGWRRSAASTRRPTRPTCSAASSSTRGRKADLAEGARSVQPGARDRKDYAAAYAGIASYYAILPFYSSLSPAEVFPKARAAAREGPSSSTRTWPRPTPRSPTFAPTTSGTGRPPSASSGRPST